MHDKRKKWLFGILAAALAAACALTVVFSRHTLFDVVDSSAGTDALYCIDQTDRQVSLLKTDGNGNIQAEIRVPKQKNGNYTNYTRLSVDGTQVYVYAITRSIVSNAVQAETVFRCNFTHGTLETIWNLPVQNTAEQNHFAAQVRDGVLSYVDVQNDAESQMTQAILYTAQIGEKNAAVTKAVQYDLGIGFTDFFYTDTGKFLFTTPEGKLFAHDAESVYAWTPAEMTPVETEEGMVLDVAAVVQAQMQQPTLRQRIEIDGVPVCDGKQVYPAAQNTGVTGLTHITMDGQHTLYFMNAQENQCYAYDAAQDTLQTLSLTPDSILLEELQQPFSAMQNVRYTDPNTFTATVTLSTFRQVLGCYADGTMQLWRFLWQPPLHQVKVFVLSFFAVWLLAVLLYIGWELILWAGRGRFPIVMKVVLACIPVVICSMFAMQAIMSKLFVEQMVDAQYQQMYLIAQQQKESLSAQLIEELDLNRPYDDLYYYQLRQILTALPADSTLYTAALTDEAAQQVHNFSYYWLYKVAADGQLVSVFCDQNYINVPIQYTYDSKAAQLYQSVIDNQKTVRTLFHDSEYGGSDWVVLLIPIVDESGQVAAVMETGTTKIALKYAVQQNINQVNRINFAIFAALLLILIGLIVFTLIPLGWLKQSVLDITAGNLGVQARIRGNDEIADISAVFNKMSHSVAFHVEELHTLNAGYYRFVPFRMFQLLRKNSVTDVHLGDQVHPQLSVLSCNVTGFTEMAGNLQADEIFTLINQIYAKLVPLISRSNGVVDRFENAGLIAFYTAAAGCKAALTTAVSICQTIEQNTFVQPISMTHGISYGAVMLGIVGHEERLSATTVSEYTNLSSFLQRIAPKYGAHILITETAKAEIADFAADFHARWLGFIRLEVSGKLEKVYDVYDGDAEGMRDAKKRTRAVFEQGVALYCEKKFYEARLLFIEVLKNSREDAAAKEYLYRCDTYYQMQNTDALEIWLETY